MSTKISKISVGVSRRLGLRSHRPNMYDSGSFSLPEIKYINFVPPSVSGCHGLMTHYSLTKFHRSDPPFRKYSKINFWPFWLETSHSRLFGGFGCIFPFPL